MKTRVQQLKAVPELRAQYEAWLKEPMTEFAMEAVREVHRPAMINVSAVQNPTETLAALFVEQAGIEAALTTMAGLLKLASPDSEVEATWQEGQENE